jgi:hypothetical protein
LTSFCIGIGLLLGKKAIICYAFGAAKIMLLSSVVEKE